MPIVTNGMAIVKSPPVEPPDTGLIASLSGPYLDPPDQTIDGHENRFEAGFSFNPEQMAAAGAGAAFDPCNRPSRTIQANLGNVSAMPFVCWAGDSCSAFGWSAHDFEGRARRALVAVESKQIAQELWKGTLAQAAGWANHYLASDAYTDTLTHGPVSPSNALALLEQGIAQTSNGQRGMIHCTPQLGSLLSELGNVFRTPAGNLIQTYRGTIVVPDAGYDGSGPQGQPAIDGSQWAYATLMVTVRRAEIVVYPETLAEAVNRSSNFVEYTATREAAYAYPWCTQVAVEVNMPLALIGGTS